MYKSILTQGINVGTMVNYTVTNKNIYKYINTMNYHRNDGES